MNACVQTVRRHSRPMAPLPTDVAPRLARLEGIDAVLFDVYGTLFVSAGGGHLAGPRSGSAFREALGSVDLATPATTEDDVLTFHGLLRQQYEERRAEGVVWPEVDIEQVWRETLEALRRAGRIADGQASVDLRRLAIEYECRANPVWPMPGCRECLETLRGRGLRLGLVSNCQFYTLELFPALLGASVAELGLDPGLLFLSYRLGQAKPGTFLYERAAAVLGGLGIPAARVLHVGDDLARDVWPAAATGFRTALFAGDARSCGWARAVGSPGRRPDLVLTELAQLADCLPGTGTPRP